MARTKQDFLASERRAAASSLAMVAFCLKDRLDTIPKIRSVPNDGFLGKVGYWKGSLYPTKEMNGYSLVTLRCSAQGMTERGQSKSPGFRFWAFLVRKGNYSRTMSISDIVKTTKLELSRNRSTIFAKLNSILFLPPRQCESYIVKQFLTLIHHARVYPHALFYISPSAVVFGNLHKHSRSDTI